MDDLQKAQRSHTMRQIKSTGSSIEDMLCKELWHRGLRYRKNVANIVGKPDIVFRKAHVVVFCDGEFWHGYNWSEKKPRIKTNREADCKNKLNFFSPKSIWRPRPRAEGALAPSCWLQSTVGAGGQGRQPERLP